MGKPLRIIVTVLVVIAVIALIGWVLSSNKKKNEAQTAAVAETNSAAIAVTVDTVKRTQLALSFAANGNFMAASEISLAAEKSGRVTRILVDEGSYVTKGQLLVTIKMNQLSVELDNAKASYANALRDKERYENAFATGGVTRQQLDQAILTLKNAEAKVQQAAISIDDANILAPFNGVVNKRHIEPGAVLSPGTALFDIVDVSKLKLQVLVNESQVVLLKKGDNVKIKASVFPDKTFDGVISFIAAKSDESLNFTVELEVKNQGENLLKAGMYGTASFEFPATAPAIAIPRSAFVGSVSSNQVFVLDKDKARIRKVTAGRITGDVVEVLDGLSEGEVIISSGQINLVDGSQVQTVK
ncbi:efflux RND transporter periplasmic adaptor subunit [Filimonas effusa]|uniref:Efflux RND transporter periplasmic adaptor subunit n=1 Tax=Filimonas effusa TaxID=2508721 RepID=A0A4Q1D4J2_9BACT|nr:efflux RND transporter periplasmic adaptor subunit [Filimonas effusa]RXK83329.1 efflux RND transporter periplasmic adaptor subunit [Filimonas effusa]